MSSVYFKIEAYENGYGCPELNLMGYDNIEHLAAACWNIWNATHSNENATREDN